MTFFIKTRLRASQESAMNHVLRTTDGDCTSMTDTQKRMLCSEHGMWENGDEESGNVR